ncbi:MAG: hypothetical protein ACYC6Y_17895 [Thermoguttaceae bacterium]
MIQFLDAGKIPFMLTGSWVSSMQGEPRASHDIDLVVQLDRSHADSLVSAFPAPKYYLSVHAVQEAIDEAGMFNLLDVDEGDKVDFWMLTNEPFDRSRFERRVVSEVLGIRACISSPEDTILAKLRWAELSGGSEKQFVDALRVYEVQRESLELDYIAHWAEELGIAPLWLRLQREADWSREG